MRPADFSAAVLAGGYSTRMGRDKAGLKLGGKTLIELQTEKLLSLGIRDVMLSGYEGRVRETRQIPDLIPHRGPLSGLHACLQAAEQSACLVLSVDVPLVPAWILRKLLESHRGGITVLTHGERREPLIAVYDCALCAEAERILQSGKAAMMKLLDAVPVTEVPYDGDEELLLNCNTPEDFERIVTRWNTF